MKLPTAITIPLYLQGSRGSGGF